MVEENSEKFKQLALENLARQNGFLYEDLELCGRILSLEKHYKIKSLFIGSPSDLYEVHFEENIEPEKAEQFLTEQGLEPEERHHTAPYHTFHGCLKTFYIELFQPDGIRVYRND